MSMIGQPDLAENQPCLLQDGAFVIQLREDSSFADGRLCGRVEHVRSGISAAFQTLEALVAFMGSHAGNGTSKRKSS